jgi:hypothetical protein
MSRQKIGVRLFRHRFREAGIPFSGHLSEKSGPFKKRILSVPTSNTYLDTSFLHDLN